ncbi:MAG: cysteine--tRNA ligase, partial [Planctomycetota bacterium]|nr:cysteine--tRNA ligase [Planctomycetota bacterium]
IDAHSLVSGADPELSEVKSLIKSATIIRELSSILGLFIKPPATAGGDDQDTAMLDQVVHLLIDLRKEARERKDYATGDAIRDRLSDLGIALLDKKEGTSWERS